MVGSMGQVGSAGDNAAMESFFALLQKNVLNRRRWATRDELRIAIVTWIERTYHRRRRQAAPRPIDPHRIRNHHDPTDGTRRLNQPVTSTRQSRCCPWWHIFSLVVMSARWSGWVREGCRFANGLLMASRTLERYRAVGSGLAGRQMPL